MEGSSAFDFEPTGLRAEAKRVWSTRLAVLNAMSAAVHATMLVVCVTAPASSAHVVDIIRHETVWASKTGSSGREVGSFSLSAAVVGDLSYKTLTAIVLCAAIVSHVYVILALSEWALPSFHAHFWTSLLGGSAPHRWAEYSVSASAQVVTVAVASGTRDVFVIVSLVSLHVGTMVCGHLSEVHARHRWSPSRRRLEWVDRWSRRTAAFVLGCVLAAFAWTVLVVGISLVISDTMRVSGDSDVHVPGWVVAALFGTMAAFFSFAVVHIVFLSISPSYTRFVAQELVYMVLSVTSKIYLSSLLLANVLMVDNDDQATFEQILASAQARVRQNDASCAFVSMHTETFGAYVVYSAMFAPVVVMLLFTLADACARRRAGHARVAEEGGEESDGEDGNERRPGAGLPAVTLASRQRW
jgi:hypothetical protein